MCSVFRRVLSWAEESWKNYLWAKKSKGPLSEDPFCLLGGLSGLLLGIRHYSKEPGFFTGHLLGQ